MTRRVSTVPGDVEPFVDEFLDWLNMHIEVEIVVLPAGGVKARENFEAEWESFDTYLDALFVFFLRDKTP